MLTQELKLTLYEYLSFLTIRYLYNHALRVLDVTEGNKSQLKISFLQFIVTHVQTDSRLFALGKSIISNDLDGSVISRYAVASQLVLELAYELTTLWYTAVSRMQYYYTAICNQVCHVLYLYQLY